MNPDHDSGAGVASSADLLRGGAALGGGRVARSAADRHGQAIRQRGLVASLDASGFPQLIARLAVGGMFGYLAIMKLRDPLQFLKLTRDYHILPTHPPLWLNLTALTVPYIELLCAAALILGLWRRGAALVAAVLLLGFTPLLFFRAWSMYQGGAYPGFCAVKFDCGCGTGEVYICSKLAENVGLLLGALLILLSRSRWLSLDALLARGRTAPPGA